MAKIMLNQTVSRPILYNFAQQQIAKSPSDWLNKLDAEKDKFLATIEPVKECVKKYMTNLYPKDNLLDVKTGKKTGDLDILSKYDQTISETCFWFTDRDEDIEKRRYSHNRDDTRSIYANFNKTGYGDGYSYGSSKKEIGNISKDSTIALFFKDLVDSGIDVMKYLYHNNKDNEGLDYNGKKLRWQEEREIGRQIDSHRSQFMEDNGLEMQFTMPPTNYSCYQRAFLVNAKDYETMYSWIDALEGVHLKFHKYQEEMKKKFKAYTEVIRNSRTLEGVIEQWSEAEQCRSKITGQSTALALTSADSLSIIQQDMMSRQVKDKVAVVVTPKDSTVISDSAWGNA